MLPKLWLVLAEQVSESNLLGVTFWCDHCFGVIEILTHILPPIENLSKGIPTPSVKRQQQRERQRQIGSHWNTSWRLEMEGGSISKHHLRPALDDAAADADAHTAADVWRSVWVALKTTGGSGITQRGRQPIIWPKFAINCMKMKKIICTSKILLCRSATEDTLWELVNVKLLIVASHNCFHEQT